MEAAAAEAAAGVVGVRSRAVHVASSNAREPDVAYNAREVDVAYNAREPDVAYNAREVDDVQQATAGWAPGYRVQQATAGWAPGWAPSSRAPPEVASPEVASPVVASPEDSEVQSVVQEQVWSVDSDEV